MWMVNRIFVEMALLKAITLHAFLEHTIDYLLSKIQ